MSFVNAERNALAHVKSVINYEHIKNMVECCLNFGLKAEMAHFGIIEKILRNDKLKILFKLEPQIISLVVLLSSCLDKLQLCSYTYLLY